MLFIDGSNFYHAVNTHFGAPRRVDFAALTNELCGVQRRLIQANYYNVPLRQQDDPVAYGAQQKFFNYLRSVAHLSVHFGRLAPRTRSYTCPQCGHVHQVSYREEKGVDTSLATHMLTGAFDNLYDVVVLVSEDADFVPGVDEVRRFHKEVENAGFHDPRTSHLAHRCDRFVSFADSRFARCFAPPRRPASAS